MAGSAMDPFVRSGDFVPEAPFRGCQGSILVVDDEPGIRNFLQRALAKKYPLVDVAGSVEQAEELRQRCHYDLIVTDIRLPDISGVDWVRQLQQNGERADFIFMTAYADVETAVSALRIGAGDFILKPFRIEQMLGAVEKCLERRRMIRENFLLRRQFGSLGGIQGMIGESESIAEVSAIIERVAGTPSTVLIQGESGTGKELVARSIHRNSGRRGTFVPINCGSISPELLESELFGHAKGAFTGAHAAREGLFSYASGGTLFLDEIGEMALGMQAKLLRVLEERVIRPVGADREVSVDVRIIAATNRCLADQVGAGKFREDLYYRLNVLAIEVPPLRERKGDIPLLIAHFSDLLASELGVPAFRLDDIDLQHFCDYHWPGNVRELRNVVERSLLLGKSPRECLEPVGAAGVLKNGGAAQGYDLALSLAEVEKRHMLAVLEVTAGNKSEAARRLGVSRKTLERKLHAWGEDTDSQENAR